MENSDLTTGMINIDHQEANQFPEVVDTGVRQNEHEEKIIGSHDKKVYLVHTEDRIGCDAALLLTIQDDGTEHVVVTHYDPLHVQDHVRLITEKTSSHPQGKRFAFLVTRGDEGDEWREKVTQALHGYLNGAEPDIVALPNLNENDAKELAKPENRLNYQLCFTKGYGGDMKQHRVRVPQTDYDKRFTSL